MSSHLSPDEWEIILACLITMLAMLAITVTAGWVCDMLDYLEKEQPDDRPDR